VVSPEGMEGLATFLKSPSCFTLQELRLNNTGCGVTGGKHLAKLLKQCYELSVQANHPLALKVFVLGRSRQENDGATALAEVFGMMGSLEEVVMPQNGIYFQGLTALADALSNNPNLRILNLNDNTFTSKGAKAMAKALKKLNKLEVLNLGDCLLKSAGAKYIARALKGRHPELRDLVLDSNEIRISGGLEVLEAIKESCNLQRLSMDANCFGESGEQKLRSKLEEMGKEEGLLVEMEDNEEPDLDEEDPDVSEDELEEEKTPQKSLFGAPDGAVKNLFGAKTTATNIFSTPKAESGSIFGGVASSQSSPFSFGGGNTNASGSIFGGNVNKTESGSSLFGGSGAGSTLFGGGTVTPPKLGGSLFGSLQNTPTSGSIFGGTGSSSSIFGGTGSSSSNIFGGSKPTEGTNLFGSSTTNSPGTLFGKPVTASADSTSSAEKPSSGPGVVLGANNTSASFASIAASGTQGFSFGNSEGGDTKSATPFSTAGNVLFASKNEDDGGEDDEHDPHFEPIVPLPELVEVKTGEEEEQVIFKYRAKVYRHDDNTKEWKERGVGDIKILHNQERNTFRVLLRREQVHKVALNHLITPSMEINPMKNSDTAVCWYATDYSEGSENGDLGMFAVRFKTKDTCEDFKTKFKSSQSALATGTKPKVELATGGNATPLGGGGGLSAVAGAVDISTEDNQHQDEYDEDYDDTREEEDDMFSDEAVMEVKQQGGDWGPSARVNIRVIYDEDLYGARVLARHVDSQEEDLDICDHIIAIQTNLDEDLTWSGLDYSDGNPVKRSFRIKFDKKETEYDFRDSFAQGKEFADQCGISETRDEELDPASLVYGVGGDE